MSEETPTKESPKAGQSALIEQCQKQIEAGTQQWQHREICRIREDIALLKRALASHVHGLDGEPYAKLDPKSATIGLGGTLI
jgi:hypothetical protein